MFIMKKVVLSAIVICLWWLSNFSFSHWMIPWWPMPISENGCCSYHGGVKYISTEWAVLCTDWTLSSCHGTQGSEICEWVSNYTQKDFFQYSAWITKKDSDMADLFDSTRKILEEYYSVWQKVRSQSVGSSEKIIKSRVAKTESSVRDRYCNSRDTFISLAEWYIIDEDIKGKEQFYEIAKEKNKEEKEWNELTDLFEKAKEKVSEWMYVSALDDYKYILKQEWKVKWGNNYDLVRKNINTIEDILSLQKEKNDLLQKLENKETKKEAELAKSALGAKASIIESLVPVIKSKDSETQQKVSLILESFKASSDEYTRNVGIYLSYLLE